LFKIEVTLTPDGEECWADVTQVIFDYATMVRRAAEESLKSNEGNGDNELRRIYDEVASLSKMRFHQTSPGAVYSFASSVAKSISVNGTETCLSAGSMLNEDGETLPLNEMLDFVKQIQPRNCFIERCSHKAWEDVVASYSEKSCDVEKEDAFKFGRQTEQWYGVDYYVSPVDEQITARWESSNISGAVLHLPKPNRYIPRHLGLSEDLPEEAKVQRIDKPIDPPDLMINNPTGRLWHRLDDRYALPKACVTILLRTATAENKFIPSAADQSASPSWDYDTGSSMKSTFITKIFSEALAQETVSLSYSSNCVSGASSKLVSFVYLIKSLTLS
jgi:insulysin